jgi:hypothetical protein
VRNVRSGSSGSGWLGHIPPVVKWVLSGLVIVVVGVMGCCALGMWQMNRMVKDAEKEMERVREQAEADRKARTVVVSTAQLLEEFQKEPEAADRKYKGKVLEISGIVERSGKDHSHIPFAILHAGDENAKLKVECFFGFMDEEEDDARAERLTKGQKITVRGEYQGWVSNVRMWQCVLVK